LTLLDAQSNYRLASANMDIMMGLPEDTDLIPDRNGLALPESIKSITEYEQDALQNRNDIAAAAVRKKSAELNIKTIKTDYYPSVSLTGGYVALDVPKFVSVTNAVNIGVGVKYTLSSLWKTKTKLQSAEARVKQVVASQELLSDNIRMQINQAYQAYFVSTKKIEVLEKAVEQATENDRITNNKYNNSLSTMTQLLDANVALLQSKLSVVNAKADSFLAYNRLLYVAGLLKN
jgi:outer membrane protein